MRCVECTHLNVAAGGGQVGFSADCLRWVVCEDRVLDGPASGDKGSKGMNQLDCIRGKGG